jgi:hypothetical protein
MLGEGQTSLFLGPVWLLALGTPRGDAATNLERETQDVCERRDRPVVVIGRPHGVTAERTVPEYGVECLGRGWMWTGCYACHRVSLHTLAYP